MPLPEQRSESAQPAKDRTVSRLASPDFLLFAAALLLGLSVRAGAINVVFVVVAVAALALAVAVEKRGFAHRDPTHVDRRLLAAVAIFGILGVVGWSPSLIGTSNWVIERTPGAIFILLAVMTYATRGNSKRLRFSLISLTTLAVVVVFGVAHIRAAAGTGFDVYHLHVSAANAIANGKNPYTDVVTVPDGSPNADPGDVIIGYVYPPIALLGYSLGDWLAPDTRYTSLLAWVVLLAMLAVRAVTQKSDREIALMLLLASVPGLWLVIRAAWTEPLSLMFMAIGAALWTKRALSGAAIGGMLASKQYFLVTAPVLLIHRDREWVRRLVAAALVVILSIIPFVVWDLRAFWDSAVAFHVSTDPRPDSSNLIGLMAQFGIDWVPPTIVPLILGLGTGAWAAWGSESRRSFILAVALSLAVSFLFTTQAFANYWFLIFGMCVLALEPSHS